VSLGFPGVGAGINNSMALINALPLRQLLVVVPLELILLLA
jgi:hypothetical protein